MKTYGHVVSVGRITKGNRSGSHCLIPYGEVSLTSLMLNGCYIFRRLKREGDPASFCKKPRSTSGRTSATVCHFLSYISIMSSMYKEQTNAITQCGPTLI